MNYTFHIATDARLFPALGSPSPFGGGKTERKRLPVPTIHSSKRESKARAERSRLHACRRFSRRNPPDQSRCFRRSFCKVVGGKFHPSLVQQKGGGILYLVHAFVPLYLELIKNNHFWDFLGIRTAMSNLETADTEETVTCLRITVYHPRQEEQQVFRALTFCQRQQQRADDLVKFGRDSNVCRFPFADARVSRVQFALQFFRHINSSEFGFEIKNLSKKVKLTVDHNELVYLNKFALPETCMIRFGDYQMLMQKQGGQSEDHFDVHFELAQMPLGQEKYLSLRLPVPDTGMSYTDSPIEMDDDE